MKNEEKERLKMNIGEMAEKRNSTRKYMMDNSLIKWIQQWYVSQCDGDWEHECGIKITTLDNPGWDIKIGEY
jgi:hypothetical protein